MKRQTALRLVVGAITLAGTFAATGAIAGDIDVTALWSKNCSTCHGKDAKGDTKAGKMKEVKDLTDPKVRADFKRDKLIQLVKDGVKDEKTGKERMKSFNGKLSDAEIGALVDWVLALK